MQSLPSGRIPDAADIVLIGTGFASTFFLSAILPRARPGLERGGNVPHAKRIERRKDAEFDADGYYRTIGDPNKKWRFSTGFGGSANCWTGNTPRMLPADFEMRTRFGQGMDWPFSYVTASRLTGPACPKWPCRKPGPALLGPCLQLAPAAPHRHGRNVAAMASATCVRCRPSSRSWAIFPHPMTILVSAASLIAKR